RTGEMPTRIVVRDGPISWTARVKRSWLIPGVTIPAVKNGHVSCHGVRVHSPNAAAITAHNEPATSVVAREPASGSGARRSATRIATASTPKSSAAAAASATAVYLAGFGRRRIVSRMELRAALETCSAPSNLRRTLTIAAIVGCILSIINEGDVIVNGHAGGTTAVKMCLNFVVPFIVSNLGVLAGTRRAQT